MKKPTKTAKKPPGNRPRFLPGWDEERVRKVLAHYEEQTEDEAVAEDEAAIEESTQTVMEVPHELVPAIRELIAKQHAERSRSGKDQARTRVCSRRRKPR